MPSKSQSSKSQSSKSQSFSFDWSFYATESSVIFTLDPTDESPYWVEAHGHFGRFGTVPISVMITSHSAGLGDGVEFLEAVLTNLFWRRLPAFFRQRGPGVGVELQPAIYYFGIRLHCDVIAYDNPQRLDLPRQARQQVERILRSIPPEDLSPLANGFEDLRSRTVAPTNAAEAVGIGSGDIASVEATSVKAAQGSTSAPSVRSEPVAAQKTSAKATTPGRKRSASNRRRAKAPQGEAAETGQAAAHAVPARATSPVSTGVAPQSSQQEHPLEPSPWDDTAQLELAKALP